MKFKKEQMDKWIKEYGAMKDLGMSLKEIISKFNEDYGLKDISSIRKNYDLLKRVNRVEIKQDDACIEQIAKAKADLLVNRKINIQMNKTLHEQANDNARWEIIKDRLIEINPISCSLSRISGNYIDDNDNDVIYIVGDIHYRGKQDDRLVINTFSKIKSEIDKKKYNKVSLILTGDLVDGEIHSEQQRTNDPVIEATMNLTNLLVKCIHDIEDITDIRMVFGNHEEIRLWGDKGTTNNVGKFIYWGLKHCLPDTYVQAGDEIMFDYKDKKVLLLHGHQGYAKSKAKIIEHCAVKYKMQPDYIILGHFHTSKTNQFSKNHWLITAPALKNWESNWDKANGFCGLGQYIKLKLNWKSPQITTMDVYENN